MTDVWGATGAENVCVKWLVLIKGWKCDGMRCESRELLPWTARRRAARARRLLLHVCCIQGLRGPACAPKVADQNQKLRRQHNCFASGLQALVQVQPLCSAAAPLANHLGLLLLAHRARRAAAAAAPCCCPNTTAARRRPLPLLARRQHLGAKQLRERRADAARAHEAHAAELLGRQPDGARRRDDGGGVAELGGLEQAQLTVMVVVVVVRALSSALPQRGRGTRQHMPNADHPVSTPPPR